MRRLRKYGQNKEQMLLIFDCMSLWLDRLASIKFGFVSGSDFAMFFDKIGLNLGVFANDSQLHRQSKVWLAMRLLLQDQVWRLARQFQSIWRYFCYEFKC